jgi:hypothetical protein
MAEQFDPDLEDMPTFLGILHETEEEESEVRTSVPACDLPRICGPRA